MITLDRITVIAAPVERCFDLARSVEVHLAGNVHWGEQAVASAGVTTGLLNEGDRVTWRARHFGVWHTLTSAITAFDRPANFRDEMLCGPFRSMCHDHHFRAMPSGATEMRDVIRLAAPPPLLGTLVEKLLLERYMDHLLGERTAVIAKIAESDQWRNYLPCAS